MQSSVKVRRKFFSLPTEDKVFVAVIAFGLIARLFALIVLPDAELNDTLYHLDITRYVVENRSLSPEMLFAGQMTTPLYYFVTALPFIFFQLPFTLSTARIFPFIFSAVQLFLAFALLKRIFPKNYLPGLAFVAVHPLLIIFGALNYIETFASVFVLLCFYIYWRFVESRRKIFLITMPFAIGAAALSKLSATILVPAFFLGFLFELLHLGKEKMQPQAGKPGKWKMQYEAGKSGIQLQSGKRSSVAAVLFFLLATALLCSPWFALWFLKGGAILSEQSAQTLLSVQAITNPSIGSVMALPARFNDGFWFFLGQSLDSMPFGISANAVFFVFSIVTGPVLIFLLYGLANGVIKKEKPSIMLLLCFALMAVLLVARGAKFVQSRLMIPALPLFAIAFSSAFKELNSKKMRQLMLFLFCLTAIYGIAFSAFYAMHFRDDYENHVPLYQFVKTLPADSVIAIHPNKTRQIEFISEKKAFAYKTSFDPMDAGQLYSELKKDGITHVAATCYKNPWNMQAIGQIVAEGKADIIYNDSCSNLYAIK
jgi:hypothetical protein